MRGLLVFDRNLLNERGIELYHDFWVKYIKAVDQLQKQLSSADNMQLTTIKDEIKIER